MNEKNENQVEQGLKKTERGKSVVFGGLALSKYQFETGTEGEGYRYASYFPPAIMVGFPFLFIFTAARASPTSRDFIYTVVLRVNGAQGAETTGKAIEDGRRPGLGGKRMEESLPKPFHPIFYDILFPIRR